MTDAEKLEQIEVLVDKALKTYNKPNEFVVLGMTVGAIHGILNGFVTYDAETDTLALTTAGKQRADTLVALKGEYIH